MSTLDRAAPTIDPLLVPRVQRVIAVFDELPDVVTLRVEPVEGTPSSFLPAQVSMVGAFGIGEAAISISSPTNETRYHEYTIRRAGAITSALIRLRPGDTLWTRGPFGSAWDLDLDGDDLVIAAGGIGIAPLRAAIYSILQYRERYGQAVLVVGGRDAAHLLYHSQFEPWREHGLAVIETIDADEAGWPGHVGLVPEVVTSTVAELGLDVARTSALVCGPDVMMQLTSEGLVALGVDPDRIQLTVERNMQCGNALCGHCQLGPLIVCRDGPVVRYPSVAAALATPEL